MLLALEADALRPGTGRPVVAAGVGLLSALFALQALRMVARLPAAGMVLLAGLSGSAAAAAYSRLAPVQTFLGFLAVGVVAFPLLFFNTPPVRKLLRPANVIAAGSVAGQRSFPRTRSCRVATPSRCT